MLNFTVIDYIVLGVFILERIYHIQRPWLNKKSIERTHSVAANRKTEGISLVLCIYNEAEYLQQYLESWISIDYPNLELIIINDGSEDNSLDIIYHLTKDQARIQVHSITHQGKKKALETGIEKATFPCIALTDIDCFPSSPQWLHIMVKHFNQRGCVIGFAPYDYKKHSLLNGLMQFDMKLLGEDYLKAASQGKSYMGTGRNMMLWKPDFIEWKAKYSNKLATGDDDLFIQYCAKNNQCDVVLDSRSWIYSTPPKSIAHYIQRKSRHQQSGRIYPLTIQVRLFLLILPTLVYSWTLFFSFLTWSIPLIFMLSTLMHYLGSGGNLVRPRNIKKFLTFVLGRWSYGIIFPYSILRTFWTDKRKWLG